MLRKPLLRDGEREFRIPISTANSGVRDKAIYNGWSSIAMVKTPIKPWTSFESAPEKRRTLF
jgi:hypothetical protein